MLRAQRPWASCQVHKGNQNLFEIRSTSSDGTVSFTSLEGEYFNIRVSGSAASAATTVWAYTAAPDLVPWFKELVVLEKPWAGKKIMGVR